MSFEKHIEKAKRASARAAARKSTAKSAFDKYVTDPVGFAEQVLGLTLTEHQKTQLVAICQHPRVAVAAGHRTGRTMVFAVADIWWCATRPWARVIISTPSHSQMRNTIWKQIDELIRNAHKPLGATWYEMPSRGVQFAGGNEIIGIASDTGERLQGYAARNLLICVDEAAGYPESLMPSLLSNAAGGGRILMGGNPTNNVSYFSTCFAKRSKNWYQIHISALDVARTSGNTPGLATESWCDEMAEEYGIDSIVYRARVLGQFSDTNANSVFSLFEIEQAQQRYDEVMAGGQRAFDGAGPLHIGLDVARTGLDFSVAVARRGNIVLAPQCWKIPDLVMVADRVIQYANELRRADERVIIKVDGVGVGAGVVDVLKRTPGITVIEVQAAATPSRDAYTNVRSEMVFCARDWLRAGGCIARDSKLEGEMAALTYTFDRRNKLKILAKDELRRELGRSTDRLDAVCLATYEKREAATFGGYPVSVPVLGSPFSGAGLSDFYDSRSDKETDEDDGATVLWRANY